MKEHESFQNARRALGAMLLLSRGVESAASIESNAVLGVTNDHTSTKGVDVSMRRHTFSFTSGRLPEYV